MEKAEAEMKAAGFDLDKIPREKFDEHIWADGILFFWWKHKKLPTAYDLAYDMLDEWDDPVSEVEAQEVLDCLTRS